MTNKIANGKILHCDWPIWVNKFGILSIIKGKIGLPQDAEILQNSQLPTQCRKPVLKMRACGDTEFRDISSYCGSPICQCFRGKAPDFNTKLASRVRSIVSAAVHRTDPWAHRLSRVARHWRVWTEFLFEGTDRNFGPGGGGGTSICMHIGYLLQTRPPFSAMNFRSGAYHFPQITQKSVPEHHHFTFFGGFCRSGDHHFQNFFNFKPLHRLPRPAAQRVCQCRGLAAVPEICIFKRPAAPRVSGRSGDSQFQEAFGSAAG